MKKTFKYRLQAKLQVFQEADHWLEQRITIWRQNKGRAVGQTVQEITYEIAQSVS